MEENDPEDGQSLLLNPGLPPPLFDSVKYPSSISSFYVTSVPGVSRSPALLDDVSGEPRLKRVLQAILTSSTFWLFVVFLILLDLAVFAWQASCASRRHQPHFHLFLRTDTQNIPFRSFTPRPRNSRPSRLLYLEFLSSSLASEPTLSTSRLCSLGACL